MPSPQTTSKVLIVEDSVTGRRELARFLTNNELLVSEAGDSQEALREARESAIGTVLMDHILHDQVAGIDLARQIQQIHPHCTVIFVSGRRLTEADWRQARESGIRVGGDIPKPFDRHELLKLVQRSQRKQELLGRLENARERGFNPVAYLYALADLNPSLPQELVDDLLKELTAAEAKSGPDHDSPLEMRGVAAEISQLYRKLRTTLSDAAEDPNQAAIAESLHKQLRELQEREADAIEVRFREGRRFDPEQARRNLEWAKGLLSQK